MEVGAKTIQSTLAAVTMLKYLTHKLRTQSINDEHPVNNEKIDGHDSGTESDGDLDQEDDLIQEHDMELSKSRHH